MNDVGVNILEAQVPGATSITAQDSSVTAVLGTTQRGVPNLPVRITNIAEFRERFGYYTESSVTSFSIDLFFANGGSACVVARLTGAGSSVAELTLNDRQGAASTALRVSGGYRGQPDPGPWAQNLRLDVRDEAGISTSLNSAVAAGDVQLSLTDTRGISAGTVLRLDDGGAISHVVVQSVDSVANNVTISSGAPVAAAVATTTVRTLEFRLTVYYREHPSRPYREVEDWRNLSMEVTSSEFALARINHEFTGSKYISLTDLTLPGTPVGENFPQVASNLVPSGGSEGVVSVASYAGDAAAESGIHAFDKNTPPLLITPDVHALALPQASQVAQLMSDYAQQNAALYLGSIPDRGAATTPPRQPSDYAQNESDYLNSTTQFMQPLHATKAYVAFFGPFGRVVDPITSDINGTRYIPLDGAIAGLFARTERQRGVHKAPAGSGARILGITDVSARFTEAQNTHLVRVARANFLRPGTRGGITVSTSRTASTDSRWFFVNVRRLFNFVVRSLQDGLRPFMHEIHNDSLRRRVKDSTTTFLAGLYQKGAFGTGIPQDVYRVVCDTQNNTPDDVRQGRLNVEVAFYPSRPAEEINVTVGLDANGILTSES